MHFYGCRLTGGEGVDCCRDKHVIAGQQEFGRLIVQLGSSFEIDEAEVVVIPVIAGPLDHGEGVFDLSAFKCAGA